MTDRPAASLPAGSAPEAEFFLARTEEQRRFRELLRSQVGLSRRRKLLNKIGLMRDDREPDPHPDSPWIFLFHGEGGMGKSTLIRRLQAIAEGKLRDNHPGDRAWGDRFTILKIDWEAERRNRPSLQGQRDQIAESAVLDVLFDQAAQVDRSCFKDYEQRLKDLKAASKKVSDKLQTEQQGSNAGVSKALAVVAKAGLRWLKLDDVVKDYGDQIDAATEAATELAPQVKTWLQTQLNREELEVFERPDQVLADALGKGLAKLAARKPLLMVLDTYEVVDRPECDAVVRLVMKAAGGRVSWVVAGRSNLRNSGKRGEVYFKGYGDDFPEAKIYAKALDEFGEAEIREYFARKVPDRPIDDADAQAIREFSLGIPFMVAEIVSIWRDCPQLSWQQILAPAPADDAKPPRDRAIAAMTERFLFHCLQQGRDEAARTALTQDLAAIYGLAIARRPDDRPLLRAMLQKKDLSPTLANLQARYSFVFADQCRLHDNLLAYLRPYLLAAAQRESPAVQGLNDRALAHLNERLAAKQQEWPELGDRFESENAKALWLDAAHHHFWKAQDPDRDETAAWKFWLGVFVDAWLVNRAFAGELVQVLAGFERGLSADGRRRWGLIQDAWDKRYEFDCDRRKALLDELDKLAQRGWLTTDQHPERAATLELERVRLLYEQKRNSAALHALAALDHRWANPSLALREAIAALYDDLARRFLLPKDTTFVVASSEGLLAAKRACALQTDQASYLDKWAVVLNEVNQNKAVPAIYQQTITPDLSFVHAPSNYNLGLTYSDLKWHEEAIDAYQQAIKVDPNQAMYHHALGVTYRDLKRYEEAIAAYQQAINCDPHYASAHISLGKVYSDLQRYEEAIAAYQQVITLHPNDVNAHNKLGDAYYALQRYEEAIDAYQQVIAIEPSYLYTCNGVNAHNGLGNAYYALKRYEEAIDAYQQAIAIKPNYATPYNGLGLAYRDLKRYEEAIDTFQQVITLNPNYASPHNNLGLVYRDLKQYEEAITAYQQAITLDSAKTVYHNNLGNAYRDLKQYEEAITAFQQAITLDPDKTVYHNNLGLAYHGLKRYEEAIAAFQQAIALDPNYACAHNNLGVTYCDLKRYEEAIDAYQQAIKLDSDKTVYHDGLGNAYYALKRYEEAIEAFQQAIKLDPSYASPHNGLGNAYRDLKRYEEAIEAFQQAITLDPDKTFYHNNLGLAYSDLKQYKEAITAFQQAITLDPNYVDAHNELGNAYSGLKRYEEAIAAYQQAIALDSNYATPHNGLGNAYSDLKRYEEAIAAYQQALHLDPNFVYAHSNLGLTLADLERYSEAEAAYRQALNVEERAHDFSNLGNVLKAQERYNEAIEAYQRAIEMDPNNRWDNYCLGWLFLQQNNLELAEYPL